MIKKNLWRKIGGFDKRFIPAYYEDTDFAFQLRKLGYKVFYQPRSVVEHYEGIPAVQARAEAAGALAHVPGEVHPALSVGSVHHFHVILTEDGQTFTDVFV